MMDYSELVKDLRYCADMDTYCSSCKYFDENCEQKLIAKAADAIEELNKYADAIRKLKCEGGYLQQIKYHDGYQAIATMPLPEPPKEET